MINLQEQLVSESIAELPSLSSSSESIVPEQSLDILATMHYTYAPLVKNSLPKLSKKELYRIVNAIVEIPPDKAVIDKFNQAQKNVYFTLEKVLMSKYFMMYNVALEKEMGSLTNKETNESSLDTGNNGSTDSTSKE